MTRSSRPVDPLRHWKNETTLVGKIWEAIDAEFAPTWGFKVHGSPYQTSGIPDLLLCVRGRLVGIEVKNPGVGESVASILGRVTFLQQQQIDKINAADGVAGVAWNVAMARDLVLRALVREAA